MAKVSLGTAAPASGIARAGPFYSAAGGGWFVAVASATAGRVDMQFSADGTTWNIQDGASASRPTLFASTPKTFAAGISPDGTFIVVVYRSTSGRIAWAKYTCTSDLWSAYATGFVTATFSASGQADALGVEVRSDNTFVVFYTSTVTVSTTAFDRPFYTVRTSAGVQTVGVTNATGDTTTAAHMTFSGTVVGASDRIHLFYRSASGSGAMWHRSLSSANAFDTAATFGTASGSSGDIGQPAYVAGATGNLIVPIHSSVSNQTSVARATSGANPTFALTAIQDSGTASAADGFTRAAAAGGGASNIVAVFFLPGGAATLTRDSDAGTNTWGTDATAETAVSGFSSVQAGYGNGQVGYVFLDVSTTYFDLYTLAAAAAFVAAPISVSFSVAITTRRKNVPARITASRLRAPTVVRPASPSIVAMIALQAVARRLAGLRRQPHWDLSTPTVLAQPPPLPAPLRVALAAVGGRAQLARHASRSLLGEPTIVLPLPTLRVQTVEVALAAVADRVARPRRASRSLLAAPATSTAAAPQLAAPITTSLVAVRARTALLQKRTDAQSTAAAGRLTPSLRSAGAGANSAATANLSIPYPAAIGAGDLLVLHIEVDNNLNVPSAGLGGWTLAFGPDVINGGGTPPGDPIQGQTWVYTKAATGAESGSLAVTLSGAVNGYGRMYAFASTAGVVRGGSYRADSSTSYAPPALTTTLPGSLVVALGALRANRAVTAWTGATGGTYSQPVAPFTGSVTLNLQTAALASPGTISGGALAITSAAYDVRTFELLAATAGGSLRTAGFGAFLAAPLVAAPTAPAPSTGLLSHAVAESDRLTRLRRGAISQLGAPAVAAAAAVAQTFSGPTVTAVAARTRTELVRRASRSLLGEPAVVLPLPTLRAETISVSLAAVLDRVARLRRTPHTHLGTPTALQAFAGPSVALAGRTRAEAVRRAPTSALVPPAVVLRTPALREQTVHVALVAVTARVARGQHGPRSKLSPPTTLQTFDGPQVALGGRSRSEPGRRTPRSHLAPPVVVLPLPGLRAETLAVATVAVADRAARGRRAPHSRLAPPVALATFAGPAVATASVRTRAEAVRRAPHPRLAPPTAVLPLPTLRVQTIAVATVAATQRVAAQRRRPLSHLAPPVALQTFSGVPPALVAVRGRLDVLRRRPVYRLSAPAAVVPLPDLQQLTVAVYGLTAAERARVDAARRRPTYRLSTPTIILPLPTLRAETVSTCNVAVGRRAQAQRRRPVWALRPPTVILPLPTLRVQTVEVALAAVADRVARPRRAPHSRLSLPSTLAGPPVAPLRVTLAGRTRIDAARRAPHARLAAPRAVLPLPGLRVQTVQTTLAVRARIGLLRRPAGYIVRAPTVVTRATVAPPVDVTLARVRPRRTLSRLTPPALVVRTVPFGPQVALVAQSPRRAPFSRLAPPITLATFAGPQVTLARSAVRRPVYRLAPPTALRTFAGPAVTITAARQQVERARRGAVWALRAPAVLRVFAGPSVALTGPQAASRVTRAFLRPPAVVEPSRGRETLQVAYLPAAVRLRTEAPRRAPHSRLAPPAVVRPFVAPFAPVSVWLAAVAARLGLLRRQPHSRLAAPVLSQRPGFASGYDVAAAAGAGLSAAAAAGSGVDVAATSAAARDTAKSAAEGHSTAAAGATVRDEPGGTPP